MISSYIIRNSEFKILECYEIEDSAENEEVDIFAMYNEEKDVCIVVHIERVGTEGAVKPLCLYN